MVREVCTNKPFLEFLWCDVILRTLHGYGTVKQCDKSTKTKKRVEKKQWILGESEGRWATRRQGGKWWTDTRDGTRTGVSERFALEGGIYECGLRPSGSSTGSTGSVRIYRSDTNVIHLIYIDVYSYTPYIYGCIQFRVLYTMNLIYIGAHVIVGTHCPTPLLGRLVY